VESVIDHLANYDGDYKNAEKLNRALSALLSELEQAERDYNEAQEEADHFVRSRKDAPQIHSGNRLHGHRLG
jgi:uncharacterized protein YukE